MKRKDVILGLFSMYLLAFSVSAWNVAVVVDKGGSIKTSCRSFTGDPKADFLCRDFSDDFNCQYWDAFGSYGVCSINGRGQNYPSQPCFGAWGDPTWSIYTGSGEESWEYTPLGISYIDASDGLVIGFVYGVTEYDADWNPLPPTMSVAPPKFCDICGCGGHIRIPKIMQSEIINENPDTASPLKIKLTDDRTERGVEGATVEVFDKTPGLNAPLASKETSKEGMVDFLIDRAGEYTVRISGTNYPQKLLKIFVSEATTTSSSTTSTTTTSTTTSTTTTISPPDHFLEVNSEEIREILIETNPQINARLPAPEISSNAPNIRASMEVNAPIPMANTDISQEYEQNIWRWFTSLFS